MADYGGIVKCIKTDEKIILGFWKAAKAHRWNPNHHYREKGISMGNTGIKCVFHIKCVLDDLICLSVCGKSPTKTGNADC